MTKLIPVHPGNRIELPSDWAAELGLSQYAAVEKTKEGILVHACSDASWDEVFSKKLRIGSATELPDGVQVNGDNLLL